MRHLLCMLDKKPERETYFGKKHVKCGNVQVFTVVFENHIVSLPTIIHFTKLAENLALRNIQTLRI